MIQVKHLTITHKKDLRTIVEDFTFALQPGDKAAIIGEEGNGKSTLLKLMVDEALVEDYVSWEGEIIRGRKRIGYLAQELTDCDKLLSVYAYCSEESGFFDLRPAELARIAAKVGLSIDLFYSDRQVGTLSGGEKVKLQLARIMFGQPDVLLLDEPSNDLDVETIKWLEDYVIRCPLPILYISHDEEFLRRTANRIVHLERVRRKTVPRYTIAGVGYEAYVGARLHHLEHQEQVARAERREYEKQQERFRRIAQKVEHQQESISRQDPHGGQLLKKKMHVVKSLERRFEKEFAEMTEIPDTEDAMFVKFGERAVLPAGKIVLEYELPKLRVGDNAQRVLARNIFLRVVGPEHICIIGANGVGKTTLLKKIAEQLLPRRDIKAAYMPQNYEELLEQEKTPVEFLSITGDKEENVRISTYLGSMKYTREEMFHPVSELSGGQKAKLLLLNMSMQGCNVLILDEPTRNFSPLSAPVIRQMLAGFSGAIISVSHDRTYIREVCDRVYQLERDGLRLIEADKL
ncbi:MAG: ABC-F family ATP-binding cassette domain-containing protein [Lachnospiraceae bacterium]|nr:ABC-F family ATP-binding cassette domain-containing protein [Lachnospiraceae bacterium]